MVLCKPIEPELFEIIKFEVSENYLNVETGLNISLSEVKGDFDWYESKEGLLANFLTALPFGVMAMSKDIEGLVETSLNLGIIKLENSSVSLSISVRSNVDEEKDELINSLKEIADNNNTSYSVRGEYPGWAYKSDSPLREKMVRIYEEMYGEKPEVQALHAGLECGVFAYKIKDLDCISFGPNMYDIHSTKERMSLSSAERTWKFLLKVLSE